MAELPPLVSQVFIVLAPPASYGGETRLEIASCIGEKSCDIKSYGIKVQSCVVVVVIVVLVVVVVAVAVPNSLLL